MVFFLAALLLTACTGIRISGWGEFNTEYLDKRVTTAVNGIFVILVVFSHYSQYAGFDGALDQPYLELRAHLGQMTVAPFLFYSGYGMMESIRAKGYAYVRKVPSKFLKLLLRMEAAILLYLALDAMLGIEYPARDKALSFTLWTSVGNSNWYIFAILWLYVLIFISFSLTRGIDGRKGRIAGIALLTLLSVGFVFGMMKAGRDAYWYNTVMIMPAGFIYSEFRKEIESVIMRSGFVYLIVLTAVCGLYAVSFIHRNDYGIEGYTVWAMAFVALFVMITAKVRIYNRVLEWFGTHIFPIYILQRLPMIALDHFGLIENHKYICLVAVFAITLPLALAFEKGMDMLIKAIVRPFGKEN